MSLYTVQVQPPVLNWSDPSTPILWHLAVEASSQAEALAIVERGDSRDAGEDCAATGICLPGRSQLGPPVY